MVVPTENVLPDAGVLTILAMPQLSVAVAENVTTVLVGLHIPIFAGQLITGFCVSVTTTSNEQTSVPHELVAVMVTVVVPTLKADPLPSPLPLAVVAPVNAYVMAGAGMPVEL